MANSTIEQHEENIIITERVSRDLQNNLNSLNSELVSLRKQPIQCHTIAGSTGRGDGSTAGEKLPEGNALRSDFLYDFAGRAETVAIKLLACQDLIARTWKVNN